MEDKAKVKNKSKPKQNQAVKEEPDIKDASEEVNEQEHECGCKDHECNCEEHECNCHEHACHGHHHHEENKEAVYLEALQRTMAEFDNYRKRTASSNEKARLDGVCQAISAILPSVDALDNAIKMFENNEQVLSGLKLVKDNILTSFKNLGLEEIDALNKPFDPDYHNAVSAGVVEGVEEGIVVEEYQKGYKLGDRVVRYTMCRVSK